MPKSPEQYQPTEKSSEEKMEEYKKLLEDPVAKEVIGDLRAEYDEKLNERREDAKILADAIKRLADTPEKKLEIVKKILFEKDTGGREYVNLFTGWPGSGRFDESPASAHTYRIKLPYRDEDILKSPFLNRMFENFVKELSGEPVGGRCFTTKISADEEANWEDIKKDFTI